MPDKQKPPRAALSALEHQLMEILWKRGSGTAEQIREALAPRHDLKDSTIRTVLRRLQQKGYVKHRVVGKAYVYSDVDKPQNVAARAVRQILDRFCGGSLEQLLVGMVDNELVNPAELRDLARKLADRPPALKTNAPKTKPKE
jgi:BlaI family transcriptional regulator, penicillinase repressor